MDEETRARLEGIRVRLDRIDHKANVIGAMVYLSVAVGLALLVGEKLRAAGFSNADLRRAIR